MITTGNEPAFACIDNNQYLQVGLTKREYFAAMAMQGIASNRGNSENAKTDSAWIAEASVLLADALINALNKPE